MKIIWKGKGLKEKAYFNNKPIIEISKKYFRPAEVDSLKGYARQAISELKWKPKHDIHSLIEDMIVSFKKIVLLNKKSKILVTGHNGMVGSSILRLLKKKNFVNVITVSKKN